MFSDSFKSVGEEGPEQQRVVYVLTSFDRFVVRVVLKASGVGVEQRRSQRRVYI